MEHKNIVFNNLNATLEAKELERLTILDQTCTRCYKTKPKIKFYPKDKNNRTDQHRHSLCIECENIRVERREKIKQYV